MDQTSWVDGYAWFGVMGNLNDVNPVSPYATCDVNTQAMLNLEQTLCAGQCDDDARWKDQCPWATVYRRYIHRRRRHLIQYSIQDGDSLPPRHRTHSSSCCFPDLKVFASKRFFSEESALRGNRAHHFSPHKVS